MNKITSEAARSQIFARACYQMAWRWHCYTGLFVIPFMLMLSITGLVMLYDDQLQSLRYPQLKTISAGEQVLPASAQLAALKQRYPQAQVRKYIPAKHAQAASFFVVSMDGQKWHIALNPYSAEVLAQIDRGDSWYALANDIHGTLLLGESGDRAIEVATGFMVLLIVSGVFLWLPSKSPAKKMVFVPRLHRGRRTFFRELHSSLGFYSVIFLLFFVLSGLAWSGIWGGKLVQAWNSFPAQKWDNVPLSSETHRSMNEGAIEEVPWNLEQTPMPASRGDSGQALGVDQLAALAQRLGMPHYQLNMPSASEGVFTLSADTMSGDIVDPRQDRTVHVDQYTGEVLADVGFADYSVLAKAMAAGIALHQGDVGWFNLALNTLLCSVFIAISVSGVWLWWNRRPAGSVAVGAPKVLQPVRWMSGLAAVVVIAVLFPLSGLALLVVLSIDSVAQLGLALYRRYSAVAGK
ncbi:MAG: PepSY-associated TM helix domain-containing protein [Pseudomonadales bacterium]